MGQAEGGGGGRRRRGLILGGGGAAAMLAALAGLMLVAFSGRVGGGEVSLALQGRGAASTRMRSMFERVHSNPGDEKALQAVEGLGGLPDLDLRPHRKSLKDSVANAARKAGVKLLPAGATQSEKLRARLAVARLMHAAEGKAKKALEMPRSAKAQFHNKMADALFDYKLYKGQAAHRARDARPSAPIKGLQVGAGKQRAQRRKSLLHQQMESALLNYHAYRASAGGEDATPKFVVPGRDIMLRTTQSLNKGEGIFGVQVLGVGGHAGVKEAAAGRGGGAFLCTQTGCRLRRKHASRHGFADAVPTVALPSGLLTKEMSQSSER